MFNLKSTLVALGYAACAHRNQSRKYTEEPYLNHLVEVSTLLQNHGAPDYVVQAGLLHDILEDTVVTADELYGMFDSSIVGLVLEVTDVSKPTDGNRAVRKEIDRKHLAKTSKWGATIKLADMISNTKSIVYHDRNFAKVYLREKELTLPLLAHGDAELFKLANYWLERGKAALNVCA